MKTKLTELLDLKFPVVQAPMGGGVANAALGVAVGKAGGLAVLPVWPLPPDVAAHEIEALAKSLSAPFGVNLNVAFGPDAHLALALDLKVPLIHFFWGDASPLVARAKSRGARVAVTVASGAEAARARDAGADLLVAQGIEAGGHVWGTTGLLSLLPRVVDAARGIPVIAAGGIADARGVRAARALGAEGVLVGTALAVAEESGAHPLYKAALIAAGEGDTALGTIFDVGWPDAPCRTLRNSTVRGWEAAHGPASGKRPGEGEIVATDPLGRPVPRYSVAPPVAGTEGAIEAMALYAGQGVGLVTQAAPAAEIVARLAEGAA
jgi:NAD(P)H-dependent flavin oxidoreductase YrpB (nitropropane dioxygenase family)